MRSFVGVVEERAQHEIEVHRRWKLRCAAKTAPHGIEVLTELREGRVDQLGPRHGVGWCEVGGATECLHQGRHVLHHITGLCAPDIVDGVHEAQKVSFWKVCAAVERLAIWREKDGHRPATSTGERLHSIHVDGVDIGAFLAVDLHVDEQSVHLRGDIDVFKALVRHHVAPVAGAVTNAQQDRHVALGRRGKRLGPPGIPIDRVVLVLA